MSELLAGKENSQVGNFLRAIFRVDGGGNLQFNLPLNEKELESHYPPLYHLVSVWSSLQHPEDDRRNAFASPENAPQIDPGVYLFHPSTGPSGIWQASCLMKGETLSALGKIPQEGKVALNGCTTLGSLFQMLETLKRWGISARDLTVFDISPVPLRIIEKAVQAGFVDPVWQIDPQVADLGRDIREVVDDHFNQSFSLVVGDVISRYIFSDDQAAIRYHQNLGLMLGNEGILVERHHLDFEHLDHLAAALGLSEEVSQKLQEALRQKGEKGEEDVVSRQAQWTARVLEGLSSIEGFEGLKIPPEEKIREFWSSLWPRPQAYHSGYLFSFIRNLPYEVDFLDHLSFISEMRGHPVLFATLVWRKRMTPP